MKIFVYRFLIIILGLFFLYQFTIGYTISKFQKKFYSLNIKENTEYAKDKIREEIKKGLKKDKILNYEDALLMKKFFNKISSEFRNLN